MPNHEFVEAAIETIRGKGNQSTHTQYLGGFDLEDFDKVVDGLFDMLSYLLINYFEKYKFGSRNDVLYSFSMLPPIIRYKVLSFLYIKYPDNISVIDKLVLATMKALSVDEAKEWIEVAEFIRNSSPANMYILCKMKILKVEDIVNSRGRLYTDFESALPYYKSRGILIGDDLETTEFNDIMNFLYMGRKEKIREISNENNPYVILNCIL